MRTDQTYVVTVPISGTQTYLVDASSPAEAKRLVDLGDPSVRDIDFEVKRKGRASKAVLDEGCGFE